MEISFRFFYTGIDARHNGELFLFHIIFAMGFLAQLLKRVCANFKDQVSLISWHISLPHDYAFVKK